MWWRGICRRRHRPWLRIVLEKCPNRSILEVRFGKRIIQVDTASAAPCKGIDRTLVSEPGWRLWECPPPPMFLDVIINRLVPVSLMMNANRQLRKLYCLSWWNLSDPETINPIDR